MGEKQRFYLNNETKETVYGKEWKSEKNEGINANSKIGEKSQSFEGCVKVEWILRDLLD